MWSKPQRGGHLGPQGLARSWTLLPDRPLGAGSILYWSTQPGLACATVCHGHRWMICHRSLRGLGNHFEPSASPWGAPEATGRRAALLASRRTRTGASRLGRCPTSRPTAGLLKGPEPVIQSRPYAGTSSPLGLHRCSAVIFPVSGRRLNLWRTTSEATVAVGGDIGGRSWRAVVFPLRLLT